MGRSMVGAPSLFLLVFFASVSFLLFSEGVNGASPDIIFVLTDDQDLDLGSLIAMPNLRALIADEGATFTNAYVTTPVCCPSRASILTGLYQHNTGVVNNSADGQCFGEQWVEFHENNTFAVGLQNAGYRTSYSGKYMNDYQNATHVPAGWDDWFALLGNSVYYDYNMSVNGMQVSHGSNYSFDYFTDLVGNHSLAWLEESFNNFSSSPVFSMIATPACHDPETPAPQYQNLFANLSAPRTPNYNFHSYGNESKHWLVNWEQSPMSNDSVNITDWKYQDRLRTLVSVDDIIGNVVKLLSKYKRLDNAYILFFSDNGYHLGQFCVTFDKRLPYETDIHVPMFVRGPSIKPGSIVTDITLNIDLAPTILYFATGQAPPQMDGQTFVPGTENYVQRQDFLIEYVGEGGVNCSGLWPGCCNTTTNVLLAPWCIDASNNTYACVRRLSPMQNDLYCEFYETPTFYEYYDLQEDPFEQYNAAYKLPPSGSIPLENRLHYLKQCQGTVACNQQLNMTEV